MATPTYIYKIVPSSNPPPDPLPDALPVSALDQDDQFIHLSTATQVPRTLSRFFSTETSVWMLRIEYNTVEALIKWEDPKGTSPGEIGAENSFPHLYNGLKLGKGEIESVREWTRTEGDTWQSVADNARETGWFVY